MYAFFKFYREAGTCDPRIVSRVSQGDSFPASGDEDVKKGEK